MTHEEQILALFDRYFKEASKGEIENDTKFIQNLGTEGISYEQYIDALNKVTSFNLADTGICDDVAYSDFFKKLISPIKMDDLMQMKMVESIKLRFQQNTDYHPVSGVGEENYAMAA